MLSSTKKRDGQRQIWPALANLARTSTSAAASGSTSPHTITGAWPPSSIVTGLIREPAAAARRLPIGMEPVKVILAISGAPISRSDTWSAWPNTTARAAGVTPASSSAWAIARTEPGVSSEGLQMMAQPAPSAPANFLAASAIGKFHGVKAATTPIA